jgi:hypothetical protein
MGKLILDGCHITSHSRHRRPAIPTPGLPHIRYIPTKRGALHRRFTPGSDAADDIAPWRHQDVPVVKLLGNGERIRQGVTGSISKRMPTPVPAESRPPRRLANRRSSHLRWPATVATKSRERVVRKLAAIRLVKAAPARGISLPIWRDFRAACLLSTDSLGRPTAAADLDAHSCLTYPASLALHAAN